VTASDAARWTTLGALLVGVASGCVGTTGHLAAATTREVDARAAFVDGRVARHVTGRSCIQIVVVVPTRMPNIGAAIDDALRHGDGTVLRHVTIRYELFYVPFVYGRACYVVEGDAS
jgi:hypothetical protein